MREGKKFFIQQHTITADVLHGGVGLKDVETILTTLGYQPITFPHHHSFSLSSKISRLFVFIKCLLKLPKGAVLIFQHPLYAQLNKLLVKSLSSFRRSIKLVCFISDIDGLRDGDSHLLKLEISFFSNFRYFIVHNMAMEQWLREHVPVKEAALVELFDFLATPVFKKRAKQNDVVFAGNLHKGVFIRKMAGIQTGTKFNIYGKKDSLLKNSATVSFRGEYRPYDLPKLVEGSFGLVWDGEGIAGMEGAYGAYNRYNSPHKLSLYIISSLPVICHKDAAVAEIVLKYGIGFAVRSLEEIESKIDSLEDVEYQQMQENCNKLAHKITTGGCLTAALSYLRLL